MRFSRRDLLSDVKPVATGSDRARRRRPPCCDAVFNGLRGKRRRIALGRDLWNRIPSDSDLKHIQKQFHELT